MHALIDIFGIMEFKQSKDLIKELLTEKAVLKQDVYDNSVKVFQLVKKVLSEFESEYKGMMGKVDKRIKISYSDTSEFQAEIMVAGDKLVFVMHTNVFTFDRDHTMWKTSYVQQTPENAYCGMISMYNFLADSFKYNRLNDIGYLIGRLFVNRENHFFVEGKRQLGFLYNDFGHAVIDEPTLRSIIYSAILYSLGFDLFTPSYEDVKQVSVEEIRAANLNESITTGKRLGFRFQADSDALDI